ETLTRAVRELTGFELLGFWDNGLRHFTNRLRPVRTPSDCTGMRVRLQPNAYHEAMIRAWGGTPVPVELSQGIKLISRGEVDAQENPLANTVAYGVDKVHRYVTMTGHLYGTRGLFANRRILEALPTDLRELVGYAAAAAISHQRLVARETEQRLRSQLEGAGLEFVDPTPDERAVFQKASRPAIDLAREELGDELFSLAEEGGSG
ncbi:MAG: TRAP transporter substrate-binding protein DctP, partial [Acidimicrobiia bacterium]|nr:TRAP transporter substrate-binding protein DctP [Acidimicrobiia bacterium]